MSGSALTALRQELTRQGLDGFIVPRADEHLGEYVPAAAERLTWLTGFTGSAGLAVVLAADAAVFTDGRYVLQLAEQTDPSMWQQRHVTEQPPHAWLARHAPKNGRIGYDPMLISEEGLARYTDAGLQMVAVDHNPIDAVWSERPVPPGAPALPHPLSYAGVASEEKRAEIAKALREAKQDAAVLTDPASIAWLLNIRGDDVPFTPLRARFRAGARRWGDGSVHGRRKAAARNTHLVRQCSVCRKPRCAGADVGKDGRQDRAGRHVRLSRLVRPTTSPGRRGGGVGQ